MAIQPVYKPNRLWARAAEELSFANLQHHVLPGSYHDSWRGIVFPMDNGFNLIRHSAGAWTLLGDIPTAARRFISPTSLDTLRALSNEIGANTLHQLCELANVIRFIRGESEAESFAAPLRMESETLLAEAVA